MRGTQIRSGIPDGANGSGEPLPRPLLRPSPSANLVGNWKGDPLGFRAAESPWSPRHKRVVPVRGDNPRARATTSELGYDIERHVRGSGRVHAGTGYSWVHRFGSDGVRTTGARRRAHSGAP